MALRFFNSSIWSVSLKTTVVLTAVVAYGQEPNPTLNPPGAPADGVFKTLNQVEPRTPINGTNTPGDSDSIFHINKSGSYYLTAGVAGVSGKSGIKVSADNVTIDLNGFAVVGVAGSHGGIIARPSGGNVSNLWVKNGAVGSWGQGGVDTKLAIASKVTDIYCYSNTGVGIALGIGGLVERCVAYDNKVTPAGSEAAIRCDGNIRSCYAMFNKKAGFKTFDGTITNCVSYLNDKQGFISVNATVTNCTATRNKGDGFSALSGSIIFKCTATGNGDSGDGAGIHVNTSGTGVRIEGNLVNANDRGIDVDTTSNIIIGNIAMGNSPDGGTTDRDYDIVPGNMVGTVVKVNGLAPAVQGNSGGGSGTTDPFANFAD